MKERPILFSGPMMRANMAGIKSVTRRTSGLDEINENPDGWFFNDITNQGTEIYASFSNMLNGKTARVRCPYGKPGDLLWARESIRCGSINPFGNFYYSADDQGVGNTVYYKMVDKGWEHKKSIPSIHMPRWACRFEAKNTGVEIARLRSMANADALPEGIHRFEKMPGMWHAGDEFPKSSTPIGAFMALWESINGPESLKRNPFVWVISYDNPRRKS